MSKHIPEEIIEEIRLSNDIVEVVSEYVRLEQKGRLYFGLCPFHKEKTPSFSVTPSMQIFKCFGCGKGGNVIHFISAIENLDFIEAVKFLADRAKIQIPEGDDKKEKDRARLRSKILQINREAARFFFDMLHSQAGNRALRYLAERGIEEKTIRRFGLGYSPPEWDALYNHLREKGYDPEIIAKSGLILPGKKGGYYDRFRDRIIFPIFDVRSNIIGFGGRVLDSSLPKYINSPETEAYQKGRNLYALNFAKNSSQKSVLVVEGYMDVISLHQGGIINAVASLGTALTENQGRLLKKYFDEIIICYDSDTAGKSATIRGLDLLSELGCNVRVMTIPEGKDPDDFIRNNGTEAFLKLMDRADSLIEYKVKLLKNEIDTTTIEGKVAFIGKIADLLARVGNRVQMEMYIKKLSAEYEVSEEAVYSEILKRLDSGNRMKPVLQVPKEERALHAGGQTTGVSGEDRLLELERILVCLLCIDNNIYKHIKDIIRMPGFFSDETAPLAQKAAERIEEGRGLVPAELLNFLDGKNAAAFSEILEKECNFEDNLKAAMDIIKKMEIIKLDKRKQEILKMLGDKNSTKERDVVKLTQELNALILRRKKLN